MTTEQMREVDRVTVEDLGIELVQMMENAGRNVADLAIRRFSPSSVLVLAGTGGNGGGALVATRHLANRGLDVSVTLTDPARLRSASHHQFTILERMGVAMSQEPRVADLVIDGIIGYSITGDPAGRAGELIRWTQGREVLALDVPSGLDPTTGVARVPTVMGRATLTLAAPKIGMRAAQSVGELYLADISVPPGVFTALDFPSVAGLNRAPITRVVD